jgi:hypothetical protein
MDNPTQMDIPTLMEDSSSSNACEGASSSSSSDGGGDNVIQKLAITTNYEILIATYLLVPTIVTARYYILLNGLLLHCLYVEDL